MASREKRPLAPSKSKQKANNESGLPSNEIKNRKGKSLSNLKQQQLTRDILEAVATSSQLPAKLEASLPRKKVLRSLKRKQKLRVAKASLIKSKVTKKVANKNLRRINADIKKSAKTKRIKSEEDSAKANDAGIKSLDNHINDVENESTGGEGNIKSAKNNLRTKKNKSIAKGIEESEYEDSQDKDTDSIGSSTKNSPKLSKKGRILDNPDSSKGAKSTKFTGFRRNNIKETCLKTELDIKCTKGKKGSNREVDYSRGAVGVDTKFSKQPLDHKSSIDLTIDEVIASMLSDSELDNQQSIAERIEGKITRSRKMLVDDNIVADIEIKKEPDCEETKVVSDGECTETEQGLHVQNPIQLRKRSTTGIGQRSLRNGKLRQLSDSGISADLDVKKHRRLNSDDPSMNSEALAEHVSDSNVDTESCFSESSGNEPQTTPLTAKDECSSIKGDVLKSFEESPESGTEVEHNNNSDRVDRTNEAGPTLRSKTKAKSTDNEIKSEDIKVEFMRITPKNEIQDELKKTHSLDQIRKDSILAKFGDKAKGRRSSLNIDMKKTVNSYYGTEKSDGNPKSQIDQMIENIKLTIAKSIESKIFGPEKGLGLTKNFEVPKIEEIIAPLSTESQKLGLEENTDEDKSSVSKNEIKSENSENSVPKVADTAKEIEKLVMGDIELAETHSQNVQESENPDIEESSNVHNANESTRHLDGDEESTCKVMADPQEAIGEGLDTTSETLEKHIEEHLDNQLKFTDENKKGVITRKSPRIVDKNSLESNSSPETLKKLNKSTKKIDCAPNTVSEETERHSGEEKIVLSDDSQKTEVSEEQTYELSDGIKPHETITAVIEDETQEELEDGLLRVGSAHPREAETSMNVSVASEESETLESISQEVERLVAEDQPISCAQTSISDMHKKTVSDSSKEVEANSFMDGTSQEDFLIDSSRLDVSLESQNPNKETTVPVTNTNEIPNKNNTQSGYPQVDDTKDLVTPSETVQCTKKYKHNSLVLTTTSCDSNSEPNSVKSLSQDICNFLEDSAPDRCKSEDNLNAPDAHNDATSTVRVESNENESAVSKFTESHETSRVEEEKERSENEKNFEEQKCNSEDNRRVLRAREKSKKTEKRQTSCSRERIECTSKSKTEDDGQKIQSADTLNDAEDAQNSTMDEKSDNVQSVEETDEAQNGAEIESNDFQGRPKRSREVKRRKEEQAQLSSTLKTKRPKREMRKSDQQNKEETLLDNEVAKINENNRSFLNKYSNATECTENFRGFSEEGRGRLEKLQSSVDNVRSKSENDLTIQINDSDKAPCENRLARNLSENHMSKREVNIDILDTDCKTIKTPETSQKDSDEASTSSESSSSVNVTPKILETPEDKAKKESILRLLGLESLEKAAERLNHQKARKEQYTGTLKTVIRVQKEKEKDKRRSRSPLKMVLKQGRGDGEGDSPEFYTIQKEFGTSGLGDSSSDEDNEEAPPKDRQSLVIPEKSSSFSIHPGRLCADVCCYCFGKFGSLDTPMHLAQMKSDERRKKILNVERHLTKDSCLCDACYRHVDRKANTSPTNMQAKPQKQHRQLMVSKCSARECRDPARHHVKRRWLLKIKAGLQNQVDIDWESSQHTSMSFCVGHYSKIERFLTCALCKRRLARNHTHQLANAETDELNHLLGQQRIPVLLAAGTFVCKLCRYFTQLQLKYKDVENMNTNHRSFFKSYRKRILHYHDIEILDNEEEDSQSQAKDKDKRKKSKCGPAKAGNSKSPDGTANSPSEKSTPEPSKAEGASSETDNENRATKASANGESAAGEVRYAELGIEGTVEKLKKRKILDASPYASEATISCDGPGEVVEILAMDKEVTLTRLPKRARTSNDITPVVQRLGANPSISVRTLFPGEEEMNLHASIEFANVREITPQGWEKCATMIQYDRDTKLLWQELQRPYGNQSSFLRHLILLEKYYRSGDLVLAPNASRNAINYSTSVQNRLISYEGPEKMDEPIMEPISSEFSNSRRLSGGYVLERDRQHSLPGTNAGKSSSTVPQGSSKCSPPRVLKLNPGVSIIKKPPPNLQRLSLPSTSTANGSVKRKDAQKVPVSSGGKVFQLSEPEYKRLQSLKRQKQMLGEKQSGSPNGASAISSSPPSYKSTTQYQKAQMAAHTQFQKHLRMQQEMLNRQSRSDFEPLICDVRSLANENSPTQNLLHNLNLPKSIQVTTKPSNPIPILPKIPKSLTVIPQTVTRPTEK
ncbi:hypothetical protein KM043_008858 [Ampulex compressa]|nr:hypothetical protein KM043_008858 [Ampulex compressa]